MNRKNRRFIYKIQAGVMAMTLLLGLAAPCAVLADVSGDGEVITHGTADVWITEDMLDNTPPADYKINADTQGEAKDGRYKDFFLDTEIQTVQIEIDENNLNYLLQNAKDEPYVMTAGVSIGDVTLGYCGLKTKGAYTLEHAAADNIGSDRFSFTINFGKYIKKKEYGETQNFFGATKISFNNFFFDKSMLKEFFSLKLMEEMGLPTPQYGLAKLYINGEYYGVYAMVEAMDESILERYFGDGRELSGYLAKPEGTGFLYSEISKEASPLWENDEDKKQEWMEIIPTVTDWVWRLNRLSNGTDFAGNAIDVNSEAYVELLSQVMDVDEVVRYFAVHSWLCQMDNMFVGKKNFGLYVDTEGRCMVLPWDYDLSFGCYFPCNAQNTANYDIDVMYQLDYWDDDWDAQSAEVYSEFPLFNVIYQSDLLMERYHTYMEECSKIATLGGTVASTGKTYEPGYFNSYVETMTEDIIAAATEKLADNVYYMNNIRQPRDVKKALPNITKIIALRSVGVWSQVNGINTTVSAAGCALETLGNAMAGESPNAGTLTIADAATGIFATAEYAGGRGEKAPMLTLKRLDSSHALYAEILEKFGCTEEQLVRAYAGSNPQKPTSEYTLTIPLTTAELAVAEDLSFYAYSKEHGVKELSMTAEGNLFTGTTETIDCIVILSGDAVILPMVTPDAEGEEDCGMPDTSVELPTSGQKTGSVILLFGGIVAVLAGGAVALTYIKRRR